jgi:ankyrin repeat protein
VCTAPDGQKSIFKQLLDAWDGLPDGALADGSEADLWDYVETTDGPGTMPSNTMAALPGFSAASCVIAAGQDTCENERADEARSAAIDNGTTGKELSLRAQLLSSGFDRWQVRAPPKESAKMLELGNSNTAAAADDDDDGDDDELGTSPGSDRSDSESERDSDSDSYSSDIDSDDGHPDGHLHSASLTSLLYNLLQMCDRLRRDILSVLCNHNAQNDDIARFLAVVKKAGLLYALDTIAAVKLIMDNSGNASVLDVLVLDSIERNNLGSLEALPILHFAARHGDVQPLLQILQSSPEHASMLNKQLALTVTDGASAATTPLEVAAGRGHVDAVQRLLAAGASKYLLRPDPENSALHDPPSLVMFHAASLATGHARDIVQAVIDAFNSNVANKQALAALAFSTDLGSQQTALHATAKASAKLPQCQVGELLVDIARDAYPGSGRGEHMFKQDSAGLTALHIACVEENVELVELLLGDADKSGNRPLALKECNNGYTAWHYAAKTGNEPLLKALVNFDKDRMTIASSKGEKVSPEKMLKANSAAQKFWELSTREAQLQDRKVVNDAASGILVGAAVIAGVAFTCFLSPPKDWTDSGHVRNAHGMSAFFCLNSLSFYSALASITLGAGMSLPQPRHRTPKEETRSMLRWLAWTAFFLLLSVLFSAVAFSVLPFLVLTLPNHHMFTVMLPAVVVGLAMFSFASVATITHLVRLLHSKDLIGDDPLWRLFVFWQSQSNPPVQTKASSAAAENTRQQSATCFDKALGQCRSLCASAVLRCRKAPSRRTELPTVEKDAEAGC